MFLTFAGTIQGLHFFGVDLRTHAAQPLAASILLFLVVWSTVEFVIIIRGAHSRKPEKAKGFFDEIPAYLQHLASNREHHTIIRLRNALSRLFWVEGRLTERVAIGLATENAAAEIGDKQTQISALVDDLGWTLVALRQYDRAEGYIQHGLALADSIDAHYWIAKSHRHLAGIHTMSKRYESAYEALDQAEAAAQPIKDAKAQPIKGAKKQWELLAGIEYARAITALLEGNLDDARQYAVKTEELRNKVGDQTRTLRILALKGKIELAANNVRLAKDHFRQGLSEAVAFGRRDEMIRNSIGLAKVCSIEGNDDDAKAHRSRAAEMSRDTPVPFEIEDQPLDSMEKGATNNGG